MWEGFGGEEGVVGACEASDSAGKFGMRSRVAQGKKRQKQSRVGHGLKESGRAG